MLADAEPIFPPLPDDFQRNTFLVTGGSGFVGGSLSRYLAQKGCRVKTLDLEPGPPQVGSGIEHFQGDVRDRDLVRKVIRGVDVVVHAAAALPLWKPEQIWSINVEGTATLLEACEALGVRRVVNISTTAVYGMPDRGPLLETDALDGEDPYSLSKIKAEEIAESYRDRLCVPTLRAKLVVGPGRLGIFDVIFDWASRGKHMPIIGTGNNLYQMLHVEDLNEAVWLAVLRPAEVANDTFNIAARTFGTVRQDYQGLLDHAGFGRRVIGLPAKPLVPVLILLDRLGLAPLSQSVCLAADKESYVAIDKAVNRLGFNPRYSNLEALVEAYDWYVEHQREFDKKSAGVTHTSPLKQGVLSIVRALF